MEPQIIPGVMYIDPQKKTNKGLFSVKDKPYGLDLILIIPGSFLGKFHKNL